MIFSGVFGLPWWGNAIAALGLTHITIAAVTVYLHRHQAHRALELHPAASHFFRLWLWMTTGMVTKEWVAVHRKHHAKCETAEDPHSPRVFGSNRVLRRGVFLYVKEANRRETVERYGAGTPDDWLDRNVFSRLPLLGLTLMGVVELILFGMVPGALIFALQMVWIPFWAAGVINGVGHYWGYRNWSTPDVSTNIVPIGLLIGGEELHNNHHAYPTSAKLSNKRYEIDSGWLYIRALETCGLARVKHVVATPHFTAPKPAIDLDTLQIIIDFRYDVLAKYGRSLKRAYARELGKLRRFAPHDARALLTLKPWLYRDEKVLRETERMKIAATLQKVRALQTMYTMRSELAAVWGRSMATRHQLVEQLQDWCQRAEASGIDELQKFARELRSYASLSPARLPATAHQKSTARSSPHWRLCLAFRARIAVNRCAIGAAAECACSRHPRLDLLERDMRASAPTEDGKPGRLPVYRTEAAMVTQHRWTLSAARGTPLGAWLRRNGAGEKQRKAPLHEWENEDGAEEIPSRSDLGQTRTGPEG